jgi:hypothetical protein
MTLPATATMTLPTTAAVILPAAATAAVMLSKSWRCDAHRDGQYAG